MNHIIQINAKDISNAKEFSESVVNETYNRFSKDLFTRKERIFFGKLGEIIFLNFLNSKNIFPDTTGMFEIYLGETNVDKFDFFTKDKQKIDVKSAYKDYHKRILVPYDQFEGGRAKDYYVGVKISLETRHAEVCGFTTKVKLLQNGKKDFGEGPAYWEYLNNLDDINILVDKI
ncbi:hypothetical protein MBGDF03_00918 [Thermoplasmatales archaeon SCGC AB-540-F20]|nr:hypothetical protein MBGDF03_00918 [Thermoplasmatales archaeon SCGC AB-540-F20]